MHNKCMTADDLQNIMDSCCSLLRNDEVNTS